MDLLSYKQLQKHAKKHGIPANLKKDNLILLLKSAEEEEQNVISTDENIPDACDAKITVSEAEQNEEIITEEAKSEPSEKSPAAATLDTAHSCYATVLHELTDEQNNTDSVQEREQKIEEVVDVEEEVEVSELTEVIACDEESTEMEVVQEVETQEEDLVNQDDGQLTEKVLSNNLDRLTFKQLQNVAKSLGIAANLKRATMTSLIIEEQMAHQAEVVVEFGTSSSSVTKNEIEDAPKKDVIESCDIVEVEEVTSNDIDTIFDASEEEQEDYEAEYEEEYYKDVNSHITTPTKNTKIVFASPTPTKSGTKPYEKFNVTWTYEGFENRDPLQQVESPLGEWKDEDPSERVGGKMKGMATPKGAKIAFASPVNDAQKQYYQYNVHWSMDQYDVGDNE